MSFEQLYNYQDRYWDTGFNTLLNEGFNFKNINYIPSKLSQGMLQFTRELLLPIVALSVIVGMTDNLGII